MQNSVGPAVRGENFWNREDELDDLWSAIENDSHILLVAPRRVGKTSIMFHLQDNPRDGYIVMYIITESADSENEFWHKLFNTLLDKEFVGRAKKYTKKFGLFLEKFSIESISSEGVKFGDNTPVDYASAFKSLIEGLDSDKKLIIMMDEFAQTVENIIKNRNEKEADSFLRTHRALRQNINISSKVTFVYAGSIGLESVVAKMRATKHINDLSSINVKPLSMSDGKAFTRALCESVGIEMSDKIIDNLLEKIEWLIPFYIQLLIQELNTISRRQKDKKINIRMLELAIDESVSHRNIFASWLDKLRDGFKKKGYLYAKEILNIISEEDTLSSLKIQNIANKHKLDEDYAKEIIHSLVYDGYINNSDDVKEYRFNSPILKLWWYKNVAN